MMARAARSGGLATRKLSFDDHDRTLVGEPGVWTTAIGDASGDRHADVLAQSVQRQKGRLRFLSWVVFGGSGAGTINLNRPGHAALRLPDLPG